MQSEATQSHISVIDPLHPAFAWVKRLLFSPFDIERWFVIGFTAWLATLGSQGGGGNGGGNSGQNMGELKHQVPAIQEWIVANLFWIVPLGVTLVLLGILFYLVILWVSCRGQFMFLHNVRHCVAEVKRPWHLYRELAWSLFWFRVILGLIATFVVLIPVVAFLISVWPLSQIDLRALIFPIVALVLTLITIGLVFGAIRKLTLDFAVPLMVLRQASCMAVWQELRLLIGANKGRILLYLIFQCLIQAVIHSLVMIAGVLTCCCACCLYALPYLGTVIFLPIPVFNRSYPLFYLRQYGTAYDVFYQPPQ